MPHNKRIKLTACGTLTHGETRRRSHAAAYPQRWTEHDMSNRTFFRKPTMAHAC